MMVCSSSSNSWPNCAESVARPADATIIVDNQIPKGTNNLYMSAWRKVRWEVKN
jgi:hypothetical protein